METKDRVIVIDLIGSDEDAVVKVEKAAGHECRCGVCTCDEKEKAVSPEPALQLYELPARETSSARRFVPSAPVIELVRAVVKKSYSH